jgi:hypothetical protein
MHLPRVHAVGFYFSIAILLPMLLGAEPLIPTANSTKPDEPAEKTAPLRLVKTKHYEIHTDMDEALVTDLASRMDSMYEQYVKTFSDFKPRADAPSLPVYLFATQKRYMAFTNYAGTNTGGLFVGGHHPYLTAYDQGQGRDALRRTLQHEAFHQFAYANISRQLPPWMNEGMAQLFEESIWEGKDFIVDQIPPRRVRKLHADIMQKQLMEFDQFLAQTPHEWSSTLHTNLDKAATAYNQAWAMAYFCSSAGDPAYHKQFVELLKKLHGDVDPADEVKKAFPDLKDFRKKFNVWAAKLKPTPQATQLENLDTVGDFLLAVTQNNQPVPVSMAAFRNLVVDENMKIQYTKGKFSFSTADRPVVYFSDLSGRVFKPTELFFKPADDGAPLPDIICQPQGSSLRYRTHFYISAEKTEHEMLIEPAS